MGAQRAHCALLAGLPVPVPVPVPVTERRLGLRPPQHLPPPGIHPQRVAELFSTVSPDGGAAQVALRLVQWGQAELQGHRVRQVGRPLSASEVQPGWWGLLKELQQLHLKLHDGKVPSPPTF